MSEKTDMEDTPTPEQLNEQINRMKDLSLQLATQLRVQAANLDDDDDEQQEMLDAAGAYQSIYNRIEFGDRNTTGGGEDEDDDD
jgi:hypothetical protein